MIIICAAVTARERSNIARQLIRDPCFKVEMLPGKIADQVSGFTADAIIYER